MAKNKIIFGGQTLLDLTGDTVDAASLLRGKTAHDKSGEVITGACDFDSDTSGSTAVAGDILSGQTAFARGAEITGTMSNYGGVTGTISTKTEEYEIPAGYHDGSGKVSIAATEQAKLIATNIRKDITILGVTGSMSGDESVNAQAKTVTPSTSTMTVVPDTGYNYLSQVTVNAIPYAETPNAAGGTTVTIA